MVGLTAVFLHMSRMVFTCWSNSGSTRCGIHCASSCHMHASSAIKPPRLPPPSPLRAADLLQASQAKPGAANMHQHARMHAREQSATQATTSVTQSANLHCRVDRLTRRHKLLQPRHQRLHQSCPTRPHRARQERRERDTHERERDKRETHGREPTDRLRKRGARREGRKRGERAIHHTHSHRTRAHTQPRQNDCQEFALLCSCGTISRRDTKSQPPTSV